MPEPSEPRKWWQSAPAIVAGATAIVTAIGALVQAMSSSGILGLFSPPKPPEWEQFLDREYTIIATARVWPTQDISAKPIAELRQGGSVIVRGKIKGAELYLVEYSQDRVGFVVMQHLVESNEWEEELQQQERNKLTRIEATIAPVKTEASRSAADWIPYGTRLNPPWAEPVTVFAAPTAGASRLTELPPGKQLPPAVFSSGPIELLQKINGGEWYLVGSLNKPLGYVRGAEVTEIWPRQQPPTKPEGKLVRTWQTGDKISITGYDLENHFDLYIDIPCPDSACTRISVYSGTSKYTKLNTRIFQSEEITGAWKKNQVAKVFLKVPRQIFEAKGTTLWVCIGSENSCGPFEISPAPKA